MSQEFPYVCLTNSLSGMRCDYRHPGFRQVIRGICVATLLSGTLQDAEVSGQFIEGRWGTPPASRARGAKGLEFAHVLLDDLAVDAASPAVKSLTQDSVALPEVPGPLVAALTSWSFALIAAEVVGAASRVAAAKRLKLLTLSRVTDCLAFLDFSNRVRAISFTCIHQSSKILRGRRKKQNYVSPFETQYSYAVFRFLFM